MMINKPSPQEMTERAKQSYQVGDYLAAAQAFAEAAIAYAGTGDALMSAEMQNNRSVALLRAKQALAAFEAAQGTEKVFEDAGDFRRQGMALANQASALQALKRFNDAVDDYKKAGDALNKADEGDLRVTVMQLLSMLYLRRFKFYEAVIALQSGLAGVKNPTPKQRFMKKILFVHL
jgi:tetratricopeptide (TPR) repeat protein